MTEKMLKTALNLIQTIICVIELNPNMCNLYAYTSRMCDGFIIMLTELSLHVLESTLQLFVSP